MSYATTADDEYFLVGGVLSRRLAAWLIDLVLIAVLVCGLWWLLFLFGLLTLGLGFGAMAILPAVPFCYHFLSLMTASCATPGQQMMGLTVRRNEDLGPPAAWQALVSTLVFYLTLMTSGLLLVIAFFTVRHRTLHDVLSGLVVVRARAMEMLTTPAGGWNMHGGTSAR